MSEPEDVMIEAESVVEIVNHLLQLVLAFVGPDEAKDLIDKQVASSVAEEANILEAAKFGPKN